MKGAPAKPINGVDPSAATVSATPSRTGASAAENASSSTDGSAATSSAVRTARPSTGPTPGLMSTSTPASRSGTTMSLKKIAASTSCRRTGCRVSSLASSGVRHASSIAVPSRARRYSGSERPACRMNQIGRRLGCCERYAERSGEWDVRPSARGWFGVRRTTRLCR
ncbi:hypothetical protein GALL_388760 [mine drainage metagenome]|uniref:Uncharacterized protein n=1 Tax=mine drainage metagenome TaxID=410659 RepID=A0A1J5QHD4_9ZZZZ